MGTQFTPIFLLILVAILTAIGMLLTSYVLSPGRAATRRNAVKQMPYESGMDPIGDARQRFDVRYYLVAIEFLIFDVEVLLLYPWAVAHWRVGEPLLGASSAARPETVAAVQAATMIGVPPDFRWLVLGAVLAFLAILVAGFAYTWKKGVYEWR
ncbi:NADH-quinone oxidoreductase subunit A [soil metagenome]